MTTKELIKDITVLLNVTSISCRDYEIYFYLKKQISMCIFSKNDRCFNLNKKCLDNEHDIYLEFSITTKQDYNYVINALYKSNKFLLYSGSYVGYINGYIIYYYVVDNLQNVII